MTPDLKTLLGGHYDTFRHVVVDALDLTYSTALEDHRPDRGDNAQTFGFTIWHRSVHNLQLSFRKALGEVAFARPSQSLRIQLGGAAFYVCKAGYRPDDDIHQFRFDQSAIRNQIAAENTQHARRLFDYNVSGTPVSSAPDVTWNVMIAHCGNTHDGMCRIEIGPIQRAAKGQSPWLAGAHETVYVRTSGLAPVEDVIRTDIKPDPWNEKPVGDLEVGRKIFVPRVVSSDPQPQVAEVDGAS